MKAAILETIPGELVIDDVQIDKPGAREVLIRTSAAGCCHSDLHFIDGKYPYMTPTVLGHESAGVVEAVRRAPEAGPRLTREDAPVFQFLELSSFAEQMLVHEGAVVKIRDDMPLDRAALLGCGVMTGLGAVINTAGVRAGETVAVIGCGGVGLSAIQGAAISGAGRVIAVDMLDSKLALAASLGATDLVNATDADAVGEVMQLTGGGVDHAFEAIGLAVAAQQAFNMLKPGGTATVVGMIPFGQNVELPGFGFLGEKKIQGSMMGSNRFRLDIPRYVDWYLQGKLNLDDMISTRIPLAEVNAAFDRMRTGEIARDVIIFD